MRNALIVASLFLVLPSSGCGANNGTVDDTTTQINRQIPREHLCARATKYLNQALKDDSASDYSGGYINAKKAVQLGWACDHNQPLFADRDQPWFKGSALGTLALVERKLSVHKDDAMLDMDHVVRPILATAS